MAGAINLDLTEAEDINLDQHAYLTLCPGSCANVVLQTASFHETSLASLKLRTSVVVAITETEISPTTDSEEGSRNAIEGMDRLIGGYRELSRAASSQDVQLAQNQVMSTLYPDPCKWRMLWQIV